MKRTLLTGLGILIFNILLFCCAWFALYILFVRGDVAIGIFFALIVIAGLILQPWSLFLLLLIFPAKLFPSQLVGMTILFSTPLILTMLSTWLYLVIEKNGIMYIPLLRFWTMPLGKKLKICAIIVALLAGIAYSRQIDFPALNRQPPPNLLQSEVLSSIKDNRTYCVEKFMESEWLWRARATPQQIDAFCAQYSLQPRTADESRTEFISYQLTDLAKPYWWQPVVTSQTKQYGGDLEEGNSIVISWDPQSQVMYARSYYRYFHW